MLPALQNSGRAKWGSARADRNLKSRVSDQNGISFVGSETLQISTAAPDFSFSRAQRLWDVICAIWDLLRCTEIWKSAVREFSAGKEISQQISPLFFASLIFSHQRPQTSLSWDLGSAICFLRARRLGRARRLLRWLLVARRALMVWTAAHEVQDLLRLRARAAARPVEGRRRQQQLLGVNGRQRYYCNCKECGGSSFCEHRRQRSQCKECGRSSFCDHGRPRDYCNCRVRWQQHLRARAAVHHLHEGVQRHCHSPAQAAAWPLRA